MTRIPNTAKPFTRHGYLYKIDLQQAKNANIAPIDLVETYKARGNFMLPQELKKQKVNIAGIIPAEAIVCAWKVKHGKIVDDAIVNSNYQGNCQASLDSDLDEDIVLSTDSRKPILKAFSKN